MFNFDNWDAKASFVLGFSKLTVHFSMEIFNSDNFSILHCLA
jgi:hypothetical protein